MIVVLRLTNSITTHEPARRHPIRSLVAIRTLKRRQRRWRSSYTTALSVPVAVPVENLKPRREILVQPSGTLRGPAHDSAYLQQSSVGRLRVLLNYLLLPQLAVVIGPNHLLAPAVRRGGGGGGGFSL